MTTVAFYEIDPYCRKVLRKHWPDVPIFEDVRELTSDQTGPVDVICGGFPCQDISIAGSQAGIEGERSGLWAEIARLGGEIRPRYIIVENVTNLLASPYEQRGGWFGKVLGDLAEIGFDAEWGCIAAGEAGLPHIRDRIWLVAHPPSKRWNLSDDTAPFGIARERLPDMQQPECRWERQDGGHSMERVGWTVEPRIFGSRDGVSSELDADRIKALGNAVVPQITEMIGRAILEQFNVS